MILAYEITCIDFVRKFFECVEIRLGLWIGKFFGKSDAVGEGSQKVVSTDLEKILSVQILKILSDICRNSFIVFNVSKSFVSFECSRQRF